MKSMAAAESEGRDDTERDRTEGVSSESGRAQSESDRSELNQD